MKDLLAAAIAMHALGMIGGIYFVFTTRSWLADAIPGGVALAAVVALVWVASGVTLLAGAWGLYRDTDWFRQWLIIGSALSIVGIVAWAGKIPAGTYVGGALSVGVLVWQLLFPNAL